MTVQPLPTSPAILAAFAPGTSAHQQCYAQYTQHANTLATAKAGSGLPALKDLTDFMGSVQTAAHLNTTPWKTEVGAVWVDPSYFVATSSYMGGFPSRRYGIGFFLNKTVQAGLWEHSTHGLWQASVPDLIEMSINGNDLYMRLGAGGRHRWAAWKLLGFPSVPVMLVS